MEGIKEVAKYMAIAARTAPKAVGRDFIQIRIIEGDEIMKLADAMVRFGDEAGRKGFDRDAKGVRNSDAVILIGMKDAEPIGLNCGACGFHTCSELKPEEKKEFKGPQCAFRILDLGIAVGSAAKMASLFNVDNRIMYRVGTVARKEDFMDADLVVGIPLSATGKNIFFDR
jgi:uncharacterized ferredoxin-like protein